MPSRSEKLSFGFEGNPQASDPAPLPENVGEFRGFENVTFAKIPGWIPNAIYEGNPKVAEQILISDYFSENLLAKYSNVQFGNYRATHYYPGALFSAVQNVSEPYTQSPELNFALLALQESVQTLAKRVGELQNEIRQLRSLKRFVVPLATLAPYPFVLRQQIPLTIEEDDDEYVATFLEANISASGNTEADAINNFKDSLLSSYQILSEMPANRLGPLPVRQWAILNSLIHRSE